MRWTLFYLENLILVTLKTVKLQFQISQIPESHSFICRACGQDELWVWVETQAINLMIIKELSQNMFQKIDCFTSAVWASTVWEGLFVTELLVSQIINFWSSATDPNRDSWSRCQATSSTTAVCPGIQKIIFKKNILTLWLRSFFLDWILRYLWRWF